MFLITRKQVLLFLNRIKTHQYNFTYFPLRQQPLNTKITFDTTTFLLLQNNIKEIYIPKLDAIHKRYLPKKERKNDYTKTHTKH